MTELNNRDRSRTDETQELRPERGSLRRRGGRGGGKRVNYTRRRLMAVAAVLLLCAALVVLIAGYALLGGGEIQNGVRIGGVDVGGKPPQEARAALDRYTSENF